MEAAAIGIEHIFLLVMVMMMIMKSFSIVFWCFGLLPGYNIAGGHFLWRLSSMRFSGGLIWEHDTS